MIDQAEPVSRFPLAWPLGWLRATYSSRTGDTFKDHRSPIGVPAAIRRLQVEFERLGVDEDSITLSSNLRTRLDGSVVANAGEPADPGVAVYFRFKGKATVFACDRYTRVAANLAAIAAHIDALRRIDRYGVGSLEQALAGYRALPADTAADWRQVFGFRADQRVTRAEIELAFRERAKTAHPDKGGTDEMMMHVNRAREYALTEIG